MNTTEKIVLGTSILFSILIAATTPPETPREKRLRLKRENAKRKAEEKKAREFRQSNAPRNDIATLSDVLDTLVSGNPSRERIVNELIATESDALTYDLYQAYKKDGIKFSAVDKIKIQASISDYMYKNWIY